MRVLFSDWIFPCKYAKWRLSEIKSFIHRYDTDIFCPKHINDMFGLKIEFDWKYLFNFHELYKYDVCIFSEEYRHLQQYNDGFDGTQFIGKCKGKYLLRLKKYRGKPISIEEDYNVYYHIFTICFSNFVEIYDVDPNKHFIHVYPGGGCNNSRDITQFVSKYGKDIGYICTQHIMRDVFIENGCRKVEYCKIAPFGCKDDVVKTKPYNPNKNFNIVFTSKGANPKIKGLFIYEHVAKVYKKRHPSHNINFNTFGNCFQFISHTYLKNWGFFSQEHLDNVYNSNIDVYMNLYNGEKGRYEGFPLGCEAAMQGVVLLTTDCNDINSDYGFTEDDGVFIIDPEDIDKMVEILYSLYMNREKCHSLGKNAQRKIWDVCGFENNQLKIFNFIEENI